MKDHSSPSIVVSWVKAKLSPLAYNRAGQRRFPFLLHPLTLLLLAFICNASLWAAVTNIKDPPDELSHFDYIRHLAINHTLPIFGETRFIHSQALQNHAGLPPLYYLLGTPLQMLLSDRNIAEQILALREVSVLLGAITVALVYMFGRLLVPARPAFALTVAVLVGFNPMFTYMSAAINSDNLINTIYAALFLVLAYGLRQQQPGRGWFFGLGALLGAGLITKQTIIMGVVVSAMVILLLAWRRRPRFWLSVVSYGFWVGGPAFLISGWYFVRNWMLYGNPTGIFAGSRPDSYVNTPYMSKGSLWEMLFAPRSDFVPFLSMVSKSFWGVFDHLDIFMPPGVYDVMTALLVGGLIGAALWAVRSWRHRRDSLTRQRLLLAVIGGLILTLTFAALLNLCYRIAHQPQGRYLFAALTPLAVAIVGGWEQLAGLLRLRWLVAPLIVVLVLAVNILGLFCTLAPVHHSRYLARLLRQAEPTLPSVYDAAPGQASFVAQQPQIERLEMLLDIPPGLSGPLIWRLGQQDTGADLLAAVFQQPLTGLACYSLNVTSYRFTAGQTYTLKLEASANTGQHALFTTLTDGDAAGDLRMADLRLQVVYPGALTSRTLLRADYLLRSDAPFSLRAKVQRILYPLAPLLLLALAAAAVAPLLLEPWRTVIGLSFLCLTLAALLPAPRNNLLTTYEITATTELRPEPYDTQAAVYAGYHDAADCNVISGWAWNRNEPNNPVNIDIFDGATPLATISANIFRPDLLKAGIGNGYHGFICAVNNLLKDGQPHSIRIRFAGTTIELANTPKSITCDTTPAVTR
jgi:hypothetical protein